MGREAHTAPIVIEIEKEKRTAVFIGNLQFVALVEARHWGWGWSPKGNCSRSCGWTLQSNQLKWALSLDFKASLSESLKANRFFWRKEQRRNRTCPRLMFTFFPLFHMFHLLLFLPVPQAISTLLGIAFDNKCGGALTKPLVQYTWVSDPFRTLQIHMIATCQREQEGLGHWVTTVSVLSLLFSEIYWIKTHFLSQIHVSMIIVSW